MKDAKGKIVSEKQIEAALRKWERRLEPLRKAIVRSEHITADDLKIKVY